MAENGQIHQVTAVIYIREGEFFKAASLEDDYTIPPDYIEGLGIGSWVDLVVGGDDESVQFAQGEWLKGEVRDGVFMIYEIAKGGFSEFESLDTYICETEHYGYTACCEGIVPLGLPEGVPILLRRTTDKEEKKIIENGHQHSILSSRWIVCEILESIMKPEERIPEMNGVSAPPVVANNTVAEIQPTRKGVVTGSARHIDRGFLRKIYVWTPGLRVGIEFTCNLRASDVPLNLGDWIEFPITNLAFENARNVGGFCITAFKKVRPGYVTEVVRTTVEITLPHVLIDNLENRVFAHPEFGSIYDRDVFLRFEKVMDLTIVRGKPKTEAPFCWRVVRAQVVTPHRANVTSPAPNVASPRSSGVSPAQMQHRPILVPPIVPQVPRAEPISRASAPQPRPNEHTTSHRDQPAVASRSGNTMIPVSVVSLGATTRASDVRHELAFVSSSTNQKHIYAVWLTQSHLEGNLFYPQGQLHLGATFQGRFHIDHNQVVKCEFLEEVENVLDGEIDDNDKIMIFSDVMYRQGDTFWSNILGIVRDPRGLAARNEQSQAVVIGRLRLPEVPGYSWCITRLAGPVILSPNIPIQQNQRGYEATPNNPLFERQRELLDSFRQFFNNETLRAIVLRDAPHEHFVLERYYSQN